MKTVFLTFIILMIFSAKNYSQEVKLDQKMYWMHLDPQDDQIMGLSTNKAYAMLQGKKSKTVIVGVIDSGIDYEHEDIKDVMWTNEDEIAGNGKDDDKNGYIDDIHGWNFIGGKGFNIENETLEMTRIYKEGRDKFKNKNLDDVSKEDKAEFLQFKKVESKFFDETERAKSESKGLASALANFEYVEGVLKEEFKLDTIIIDDVIAMKTENSVTQSCIDFLVRLKTNNIDKKAFLDAKKHYDSKINFQLNPDFNPRKEMGDDVYNGNDKNYGNNDVRGPGSDHGTHVAGIIGAKRNNNIGIDGIADNVKIISVRAVPDGDERDKDIANAIRYCVDNGARVINMSFGKAYSPQKKMVDEAVQYAMEKGVLLIHAAGNDAENNDVSDHFPSQTYLDGKTKANIWLTVGASSLNTGADLPGNFSNYGKKSVDFFAPGVDIYSLNPNNRYEFQSGTSMACPATTGVAALIMSYFPDLTALEVKDILIASVYNVSKLKVNAPSEGENAKLVKFSKLCTTGGVVNAYKAVQLAKEK